ncbi:MAG: D-Ala-D-Ala carboxypeptidase family metallohydrolase [Erythrobacter sp.]|uniref:D-Ala-D-Ala carboxypeptidase family metallohydrolase n=1 Tax=Erythrobacter sp. TaxID=1042 RepID=UPI0032973EA8
MDAHYAKRCGTDYFLVPPESRWRQIIPTLRLLRDEVIPVTGPLEVASGYRSPEINDCVNGASRSKHLNFKALDLVATQITGREDIFKKLCILQNQIGRSKSMGLGAYYDPEDTQRGKMG